VTRQWQPADIRSLAQPWMRGLAIHQSCHAPLGCCIRPECTSATNGYSQGGNTDLPNCQHGRRMALDAGACWQRPRYLSVLKGMPIMINEMHSKRDLVSLWTAWNPYLNFIHGMPYGQAWVALVLYIHIWNCPNRQPSLASASHYST